MSSRVSPRGRKRRGPWSQAMADSATHRTWPRPGHVLDRVGRSSGRCRARADGGGTRRGGSRGRRTTPGVCDGAGTACPAPAARRRPSATSACRRCGVRPSTTARSEVPCASVSAWCFEPGRARSTGLGEIILQRPLRAPGLGRASGAAQGVGRGSDRPASRACPASMPAGQRDITNRTAADCTGALEWTETDHAEARLKI